MRQLNGILIALTLATFQTQAGSVNWFFDFGNNDNFARKQAEELVWDGVPHPLSDTIDKAQIVDKVWPFYLVNVVLARRGSGGKHDRTSYLVCFKLAEDRTEFRIVTVIQYASDPPTQNEIMIDKRLNRWPVSPPWEVGDELPHKIRAPGLSIVLDKSRAGLSEESH